MCLVLCGCVWVCGVWHALVQTQTGGRGVTRRRSRGQDCAQSMEETNACRWLDGNELCYAYDVAQKWCTDYPNSPLCHDGGAGWAAAPFGTAAATGSATGWLPRQTVSAPLRRTESFLFCAAERAVCKCTRTHRHTFKPTPRPSAILRPRSARRLCFVDLKQPRPCQS